MAQPVTTKFGKFRVMLGDGGSPQVYAAPCGFTNKSMTITKNLNEVNIPDCDDPDAVAWVGRDAVSLSMEISGEGVMSEESVETWLDAVENPDSVPARVEMEFPSKTIAWEGFMQVATVGAGAEQGQRVTKNITMQSDGEMTRTVE